MRGARNQGLTLVELVISLAIMAILVSLAVPEGGRLLARWKLQATAERLSGDLQAARLDAVERGLTQHVHLQSGKQWCWSVSEWRGCGCEEALRCQRVRAVAPGSGGVVLEADAKLLFEPTANSQVQVQTLPLSNGYGDRIQVTLTPMGRARICTPAGSSLSYPAC